MFVFYLCAVLLLDACGFRFGLFFVGGWFVICGNNFMGVMRSAQKACFWAKTAKIMKIALFWPQNFEKMADFCGFVAIFGGEKSGVPAPPAGFMQS